jgi:hypothetical protein
MASARRSVLIAGVLAATLAGLLPLRAGANGTSDAIAEIVFRILIDGAADAASPGAARRPGLLPPEQGLALHGQYLTWAANPPSDLHAWVSDWSWVIGPLPARHAGRTIMQQDGIDDPAETINDTLMKALADRYGVRPTPEGLPVTDPVDLVTARQSATPAPDAPVRYALNVRVVDWSLSRFSAHPKQYYLRLAVVVRLVDVRQAEILAQGSCDINPGYIGTDPTADEMLAEQGKLLKQQLQAEVDECTQDLEAGTFGIGAL